MANQAYRALSPGTGTPTVAEVSEQARLANLERKQQIEAIYQGLIEKYQPGGTYLQAQKAQLDQEKSRDVTKQYGQRTQGLISSGLYGTSVRPTEAGVAKEWERDIGQPARLKLEDIASERLSQAQTGMASFLERIQEPYPDLGMASQYTAQAAQGVAATGGFQSAHGGWMFEGLDPGGYTAAPGSGTQSYKDSPYYAANEAARKEMERRSTDAAFTGTQQESEVKPDPFGGKVPTIPQYLQAHGIDPKSTNRDDMERSNLLQKQWATMYMGRTNVSNPAKTPTTKEGQAVKSKYGGIY